MPYAPTERLDTSSLAQGISQGGIALAQAIQKIGKNREQMEGLDGAIGIMAQQHPDIVTPELLAKFSKAGLGQRQGMVGQVSAEILNKLKTQQLSIEQQRANQAGIDSQNLDKFRTRSLGQQQLEHEDRMKAMEPMVLQGYDPTTGAGVPGLPQGSSYFGQPGGFNFRATSQPALQPPNGKATDVINGPDGKPAYELRWNSRTGEYDKYDVRPRSADPFGALPAGGATQPGGQGAQPGNPLMQQPPASAGAGTYRSAAEVRAAVKAGRLDRAAATQILRSQFGMQ